ncbi:MAG: hypothetical protein EAZ97_02025 [Bacteroidetes bacterium]|nr:MAG: hypothetical protein EAZ97_02025 [Bacteroidota bacterium]
MVFYLGILFLFFTLHFFKNYVLFGDIIYFLMFHFEVGKAVVNVEDLTICGVVNIREFALAQPFEWRNAE